jgi:hypothetical protein
MAPQLQFHLITALSGMWINFQVARQSGSRPGWYNSLTMLTAEVAIVWIFVVVIVCVFVLIAFPASNPSNALSRVVRAYWSSAAPQSARKWVRRVFLFFFLAILVLTLTELSIHVWRFWLRAP